MSMRLTSFVFVFNLARGLRDAQFSLILKIKRTSHLARRPGGGVRLIFIFIGADLGLISFFISFPVTSAQAGPGQVRPRGRCAPC
ncbi:hypothetical protein DFH06DRAFT_1220902 [Mycena polygramma]|nr:hypothetical protein DFH06DRAFT_1220902 [Mycena polygramma]